MVWLERTGLAPGGSVDVEHSSHRLVCANLEEEVGSAMIVSGAGALALIISFFLR